MKDKDKSKHVALKINGMSCTSCAQTIERALQNLNGMLKAVTNNNINTIGGNYANRSDL